MEMRRFKQQLPANEATAILNQATGGVLCLIDQEGKPYGVPLSFVFDGKAAIYFHCAPMGRKIDCIHRNSNACFTVIATDEVHPELFTTYFRSVIVEGHIAILADRSEIIDSLRLLAAKYSPGIPCEQEIANGIERVAVLKMNIDSITGKEAIELTKKRTILS